MVVMVHGNNEKRYGHVITATFEPLSHAFPVIHFHSFTTFLQHRHPPLDPLVFSSHLTRLGRAIPSVTPYNLLHYAPLGRSFLWLRANQKSGPAGLNVIPNKLRE